MMRKLCFILMVMFMISLNGIAFSADNDPSNSFKLISPAFKDGGMMPYKYSGRGPNKSPVLQWVNTPEGTHGFSIKCTDYDFPANGYVHWDIRNIPASYNELPEGIPSDKKWKDGIIQYEPWNGPYPPNGVHHYHFVIEAKDINGKTLAKAELIGCSD